MGTPVRSLGNILSPKFISPHSARLRFISTENGYLTDGKSASVCNKNKTIVRKLDYHNVPTVHTQNVSPVRIRVSASNEESFTRNIKEDIMVNTPMKVNISKHGLEEGKLLNILGKGNFGQVVRGVYRGKTVAVKVIKSNQQSCRERQALNLDHPNIVKMIDITENPNDIFCILIMEYHHGSCHLQTYIENFGNHINEKLIKFSKDICEGVNYCHKKGILHLDIKPQNLLVCDDVCKLCDFGNSCPINEAENFINNGTVFYTAPELLQGNKPTVKCDIYSLGIVFWQMKHKKVPYSEFDNVEAVIYLVVKSNLRPDLNQPNGEYDSIYHSCWQRDPLHRPNLSKILDLLDTIQSH